MQKLCTRCNAHLLHSKRAENLVSIYEFRGIVTVKSM